MTQNEIISYVDKKGLEAIFKTNDFSHSLFFSDLETNPKLTQAFILLGVIVNGFKRNYY